MSGWVDKLSRASIYTSLVGPGQVKKIVGDDYFELVKLHGTLVSGSHHYVYLLRNKETGKFIANKTSRKRGEMYADTVVNADVWTSLNHPKSLIRGYSKANPTGITLNPNDLEIVRSIMFVPDMEKL